MGEIEKAAEKYRLSTPNQMYGDKIGFIKGANFAQEKICESEIIQKIRATKSDAEARRIIRTLLKE